MAYTPNKCMSPFSLLKIDWPNILLPLCGELRSGQSNLLTKRKGEKWNDKTSGTNKFLISLIFVSDGARLNVVSFLLPSFLEAQDQR